MKRNSSNKGPKKLTAETPKSGTVRKTGPSSLEVRVSKTLDDMLADIRTPTGVKHDEVAVRILDQIGTSLVRPKPNNMEDVLRHAITTIAELGPQNAMEAFLATQMVATHEAALLFLNRATQDGQTMDSNDAYVLRAMRLMRLHLDQLEAMQKLKGKTGQQKVTVEHVHVHKGGQAIVGAVSAAKPDRGEG